MKMILPAIVCCLLVTGVANAHDQIPGKPQRRPIVIKNAVVHPVDGPVIEKGAVLFADGKITAVGRAVEVPTNAVEIDAEGKHVYPGLIEPVSDIGLREISAVDATDDRTEQGDRNPNAKAWVAVNPDSELIPVARAGGVLVAMTAPRGKWLRGQTAVVHLDGWTVEEMILRAPAGLSIDWRAMEPRDDNAKKQLEQRSKKFAELDALLDEVRRYADGRKNSPKSTPTDVRLESLRGLLDGEIPLIAQANDRATIESAVSYAVRNELNLIIYGGYDAPQCADLLKKYDVGVIIAGVYRLPMRRNEPYDAPYTIPSRLQKAGVRYCIGGAGSGSPQGASNARNLPYHAGTAVAYGLDHAAAVRAITLSAAEVLGVDDKIGSLTVGKDATLLISDGDILESDSTVTNAWIQGREVDLGCRHKTLYEKYKRKYVR